jgi:TPR repeat protein
VNLSGGRISKRPARLPGARVDGGTTWFPRGVSANRAARQRGTDRRRTRLVRVLLLAGICFTGATAADFSSGVAAYKRKDFSGALTAFAPLAQQGEPRAQFALGLMYDNGEGVQQSDERARYWYQLSAEQGYAKAQFNLGLMHEKGRTGDPAAAQDWFARAARRGNADAVARLHRYADAGDSAAQLQLGNMYYLGEGVARGDRDAFGWFVKAAAQGQVPAVFAIGLMHEKGEGVEQSYTEAAEWYQQAAEQGSVKACFNLARLYRLGRGVSRDLERARTLYEAAAREGLVSAQLTLAMLFEAGQGWPHEPERALYWYAQAAQNGSADAQVNLAFLLAQGLGVPRDPLEACALFSLAAQQGQVVGRKNYDLLCAGLDDETFAEVESRMHGYQAGQRVVAVAPRAEPGREEPGPETQ